MMNFLGAAKSFIDNAHKDGEPFFVWMNATHMHFRTHAKPSSVGQSGRWQSERACVTSPLRRRRRSGSSRTATFAARTDRAYPAVANKDLCGALGRRFLVGSDYGPSLLPPPSPAGRYRKCGAQRRSGGPGVFIPGSKLTVGAAEPPAGAFDVLRGARR